MVVARGKKEGGEVQFYCLDLRLLWQNLVDVGFEEGVGLDEFGAEGALDGGFDLGFGAGGDAGANQRDTVRGTRHVACTLS